MQYSETQSHKKKNSQNRKFKEDLNRSYDPMGNFQRPAHPKEKSNLSSKNWWEANVDQLHENKSNSSYGIEDLEREDEISRRIGETEDKLELRKMRKKKRVKN